MIAPFSYRSAARLYFGVSILLGVLMLGVTLESARALGVDIVNSKWLGFTLLQGGTVAISIFVIGWTFSADWGRVEAWLSAAAPQGWLARWIGAVIILAALGIMFFARQYFTGYLVNMQYPTLWVIWWGNLLGAFGVRLFVRRGWALGFSVMSLLAAVLVKVVSLSTAISAYPLSLGWSESSRYYYASLYFAESLYGKFFPLSIMHPTRYFLQSLPFIFEDMPLWGHRAWQVILWVVLSAGSAVALVRRLKLADGVVAWAVVGWFFLYLFQGAVYYHLLVMVILVLVGVSTRHPWRSLVVVILASAWAGVSRLNWFPVPAMLAAALYFIDQPLVDKKRYWLNYLAVPVMWFVSGVVVALGTQSAYVFLSGNANNLEAFGSSFTSDLLWYRLLPGPTYPLGTIPGTLIVAAPVVAILVVFLRGKMRYWHPVRLLGLFGILVILLGGGLVVSVKIGGGGDLHNMDAFLVALGIIGAMIFFQRPIPDQSVEQAKQPWLTAVLTVFIPVYFSLQGINLAYPPNDPYGDFVVREIRTRVEDAAAHGEESLLITQRHLISMGEVDIPLVPEYEVVTLMEMAMSRNEKYLGQFYSDLDEHRFAYIVVSPLFLGYKGAGSPFGEENDVWVQYVASHLACEYEPVATYEEAQVQILAPRANNPICIGEP